ncbi:MAG: Dihydrofolate reductase [uncultured Nocardioidaceae bacterium]|uniref:Dihydrofolate reductase n=1 Tax=uncultured Nocardioidaceae bacterium TaxID=253824 RepID=A0A6J4N4C2_9ACTN|nr:MAG: Dihydrofolate reductase [uncultured Nocardioidaceae bacterium]
MSDAPQSVVLVAAVAENGVIGADGQLPWHLPDDLAHFRRVTTGNVVVMGRKTFESIGRPLPRRTNIVVTRQPDWTADGVITASSLTEALDVAEEYDGDAMVIGGSQIYALAMPLADRQVLTEVHATPEGDVTYPPFDRTEWRETQREEHDGYAFVWLERADPDEE